MDHYVDVAIPGTLAKGGLLRIDIHRASLVATSQRLACPANGQIVWGAPLKQKLRDYCSDGFEVEVDIYHDFLPNASTFVELDDIVTDVRGLPAARIRLEVDGHQAIAGEWLARSGREILQEMGAVDIHESVVGGIARQLVHGTCRCSRTPRDGVLNEFCQTHDVRNLFVVDGSFMPTSGGAPSTLTIVANSLRTADYILSTA